MEPASLISWDDRKRRLAAGAAAGLFAALGPILHVGAAAPTSSARTAVVVREADGAGAQADAAIVAAGGTLGPRIDALEMRAATVPTARLAWLSSRPGVVGVTPDGGLQLLDAGPVGGPDSGLPGSLSNVVSEIGADQYWQAGFTGKGVDVALIDSGVASVTGVTGPAKVQNGPDISLDALRSAPRSTDTFGHGTHMAGIIAGNDATAGGSDNGSGQDAGPGPGGDSGDFRGVAPDARIINVKVASSNGSTSVTQLLAGIAWVIGHRADEGRNIRVLNLSVGSSSALSYVADPLTYAAERAWKAGIVVVVSAGNGGALAPLSDPASDPYVIAAGAANPNGSTSASDWTVAPFSSRGLGRPADLVAPGTSVASLRDPGSYVDTRFPAARVGTRFFKGSGTSQAAAVTSGAAALVLQQHPDATPDQVKALLTQTATPLGDGTARGQGHGGLSLGAALAAPLPSVAQSFPAATGSGMNDLLRTVFQAGSSWSGSSWSGSSWSGSSWSGSSWSGSSWSGSSWSGSSWSGSSWSGSSWSGSSWSGSSWSDAGWLTASWT